MLVDGAVKRDDRVSNPPLGQPLPLGGVYFNTKPVPTVAPAARVLLAALQALGQTGPVSPKPAAVKETNQVYLEYDRVTRRRVLNTYEILLEIGRGEHGKVKLAKDLALNQLVAIKIILRKSKRSLFHGYLYYGELLRLILPQERKVRREISIMKRCHHPHIVQLREVLDDDSALKIYLVLEYLEKGEIKWKRSSQECSAGASNNGSITVVNGVAQPAPSQPDPHDLPCTRDTDIDLLSDDYAPNLLFAQLRRALRHVVLGLEYLHAQGIVHRDIKPANLLVSATNCVKILDFGVSLLIASDGRVDLAKTAGTPAFFAPELCQDHGLSHAITHKIDIWALGVTLYCLLFGKVPFNAPTEWELFDVICHQPIPFPSYSELIQIAPVLNSEYEEAQDLLRQLLDKNPDTRIDIPAIKHHPFTLMGCEDVELFLNSKLLWSPLPAPAGEPVGVGATMGQGSMILSELVNTTLTPTPSGSFAGKRPSTHEVLLTRTRLGDLALRRGLVEACQIETMRHARGDVYLLSTPVLATIKGIQEQDDKRRRLSIFSNSRMGTPFDPGNTASSKRSLSALLSQASPVPSRQPSYSGNVAAPIAVPGRPRLRPPLAQFLGDGVTNVAGMGHSLVANHWAAGGNNVFAAPTANATGGGHGPTATATALALLVLLLPLLELFALLDSFDEAAIDNFLSQCLLDNLGALPIPQSPLALTAGITEKLRTFNLHMGQKKRQLDRGVGPRNEDEGIVLLGCDQSLCLSDLDSDDDNANLLFLFSSKMAPQLRSQLVRPANTTTLAQLLLRPAFLNLDRRLALHDTHVGTRAGNGMLVVMIHDTHLPAPELADVPAGLFGQGLSADLPSLALTSQAVPIKQTQSEMSPQLIYSMPSLPLALTGRVPHARQQMHPGPRSPLVKHVTTYDGDARSRLNLISLAMLDRQHGT